MKKKIINVIPYLTIFILFLVLNYYSIWAADDYTFYNLVWLNNDDFSLSYIIERTNSFYLTWTGRYLSTFLNYILLYFDKSVFNIVNSLVFTSLIYFINKIIRLFVNTTKKTETLLVFLIFFMVWFFVPSFAEVMTWQIGSVIYLWTFVFAVIVLYYFLKNVIKSEKISPISYALMLVMSLCAGNGFETTGLILLAFEVMVILYNIIFLKNKEKLKVLIPLFIVTLVGFCFNFFSPGNSARMTSMSLGNTIIEKIANGSFYVLYRGLINSKIFIVLLIISFAVLFFNYKNNKNKIITISSIILIILLTTLGVMFFSKEFQSALIYYYNHMYIILFMILISLISICCTIVNILIKTIKEKKDDYLLITIYLSAIAGIIVYIFTPFAWERSYMAMSLFLIIVMLVLVLKIFKDKVKSFRIIFALIFIVFGVVYTNAIIDTRKSYNWSIETKEQINKEIKADKKIIKTKLHQAKNEYNSASVEKYVIPPILEDNTKEAVTANNIPVDYEWINIAVTNYYFDDANAWNEGKRIVSK